MIAEHKQQMIQIMHQQGLSIREISRTQEVSRKVVRRVIEEGVRTQRKNHREGETVDLEQIRRLFQQTKGNAVRILEVLQEHGQKIPYSTLTRLVREARLRNHKKRAGAYHFEPGEEMQHDTSPHRLSIGEKTVTAQCAALVNAYSRKAFVQYYPRFTRFEAKCFLSAAITFMDGTCSRCGIDNTHVVLASGSGADALIAPEMEAFARIYGFEFFAHAVGDPNRKAPVERLFHYVENNFLAGRTFSSWRDLNQQAQTWCVEVANAKEKRHLGMSPQAAWLIEKSFLKPLPTIPVPVYKAFTRVVDNSAFVHLDTNRYSVPERLLGKKVDVHKYLDRVRVYHGGRKVADHPRLIDQTHSRITHPGHHPPLFRKPGDTQCDQELKLADFHPDLDAYICELKKRVRGRGVSQFRRLLEFKRSYPADAFLAAVMQAHRYCLYDLNRLECMILERVAGDFFQLDREDVSCD